MTKDISGNPDDFIIKDGEEFKVGKPMNKDINMKIIAEGEALKAAYNECVKDEVKGCEFYQDNEHVSCSCLSVKNDRFKPEIVSSYDCSKNPNCYYKQRLTTQQELAQELNENEKLREIILAGNYSDEWKKRYVKLENGYKELEGKLEKAEEENEKLEKENKRISNIASDRANKCIKYQTGEVNLNCEIRKLTQQNKQLETTIKCKQNEIDEMKDIAYHDFPILEQQNKQMREDILKMKDWHDLRCYQQALKGGE